MSLVTATGRGEGEGYSGGDGMVDALEVLSDVQRHYRVDPERKTLHGISLGAIGTWYMATLYPDKFSAALPSIFTGSTDHLANLYNLPAFYTIGTFDQFGQGALGDSVADSMEVLGNEYLYYHHLGRFHELSLGAEALPISEPLFYSRRRVTNPARVRYVYDAERYSSKIPGDGSVYWVSGIAPRDDRSATIDVSSFGRADELPADQVVFTGLYENTAHGYQVRFRGLMRMTPEEFREVWKPGQFQAGWRELSLSLEHIELPVEEVSNGFRLDASGLEAVSLNLKRMKLTPRREIVATIDHDGALALTLLGRSPPRRARSWTASGCGCRLTPTASPCTFPTRKTP